MSPRMSSLFVTKFAICPHLCMHRMQRADRIKALFPSTYGRPRIELVPGGDADVFEKPLNMGVVLSGGQAPGGHNVIAGVFDFAKKCSPDSKVFG